MSNNKSKRQEVAEDIATFATSLEREDGRKVFNGPVIGYMGKSEKNGSVFHSIVLMVSRLLDAEIRVYSPNWMLFTGQGPLYNGRKKFDDPKDLKDFIESEFG